MKKMLSKPFLFVLAGKSFCGSSYFSIYSVTRVLICGYFADESSMSLERLAPVD